MLPACRTDHAGYTIPTFDVVPSDVEGFLDELWEFQAAFHDCFARSEPRAHFFDYLVGQCSRLERKSIEPIALRVEGGTIRGLQRFISDVHWDEEQMLWNYHQLVAEAMGDPEGVLMFDETAYSQKTRTPCSHSVNRPAITRAPSQTASRRPFRWCGNKPTVSQKHQLDE